MKISRLSAFIDLAVLWTFLLSCSPNLADAQENPAGRKLALLVGVNKYDHAQLRDLEFAENDVAELAAVLERQGYNVVLLTTKTGLQDSRLNPTVVNIQLQLECLMKKVTKRDLVVVGLAGHGLQPLGSDFAQRMQIQRQSREMARNQRRSPDRTH